MGVSRHPNVPGQAKLADLYHQNHALGPKIDSVFVHTKLSKTSTCLRKFHFHKTKWDRKCHQSCSKRPVSAVNAISVKHNLVFLRCGLTIRGLAIADFCILRDADYITTLLKACHMVPHWKIAVPHNMSVAYARGTWYGGRINSGKKWFFDDNRCF